MTTQINIQILARSAPRARTTAKRNNLLSFVRITKPQCGLAEAPNNPAKSNSGLADRASAPQSVVERGNISRYPSRGLLFPGKKNFFFAVSSKVGIAAAYFGYSWIVGYSGNFSSVMLISSHDH
jgi:hypothetical protein